MRIFTVFFTRRVFLIHLHKAGRPDIRCGFILAQRTPLRMLPRPHRRALPLTLRTALTERALILSLRTPLPKRALILSLRTLILPVGTLPLRTLILSLRTRASSRSLRSALRIITCTVGTRRPLLALRLLPLLLSLERLPALNGGGRLLLLCLSFFIFFNTVCGYFGYGFANSGGRFLLFRLLWLFRFLLFFNGLGCRCRLCFLLLSLGLLPQRFFSGFCLLGSPCLLCLFLLLFKPFFLSLCTNYL